VTELVFEQGIKDALADPKRARQAKLPTLRNAIKAEYLEERSGFPGT